MSARRSLFRFAGALCAVLTGLVFAVTSASAAVGKPVVERVWASEVHRSTAYINAVVNPSEAETTYRFEYGPDTSYGSSIPVPDGELGAGIEGVEVSQLLTGLQPGGTYHYRIVASNSAGTTTGEDMTFTMFSAPTPEPADTCSNASYRVGFSAGLPDCRAYEMVSPIEKYGGDISGDVAGQTLASEMGDLPGEVDRAEFMSKTGFGETSGSGNIGYYQYIAERGPNGWDTHGITPTPNAGIGGQTLIGKIQLNEFSSDLSTGIPIAYSSPGGPSTARPNSENLYLENIITGDLFAAVTDGSKNNGAPLPLPAPLQRIAFLFEHPMLGGASSSLDVVTFMSRANFVPEAEGWQYKAYVYEHGEVKLLGVLPKGVIPTGGSELVFGKEEVSSPTADQRAIKGKDTVSTDGSRILFEVGEFPHQLFMRKDGSTSVMISESETSSPVTAEEVKLQAATPDLKHIVFSTSTKLLDSAPEGGGLYMYSDGPAPESEPNLTYIGGGSQSVVFGTNEHGTRIYYEDNRAVKLWDSGKIIQIAPGPGMTAQSEVGDVKNVRVTTDGSHLEFMNTTSRQVKVSPTDYGKVETTEAYVYSQATNTLKCVSCASTNAAPTTGVEMEVKATQSGAYTWLPYEPRFMSNDGRYVFFNTTEALLPQDTNGVTDAYEYDTVTGRLALLSTGTGESGAWFVDASADGHDAFLVTRQQLSRWDPDKLVDLYDARVEGGLPEPPLPTIPCTGDACQGTPAAAPSFNTASGFMGLGNPSFVTAVKAKTKIAPNARLRHALAACRKKPKRTRTRCERIARRRYGSQPSSARNRRRGR